MPFALQLDLKLIASERRDKGIPAPGPSDWGC